MSSDTIKTVTDTPLPDGNPLYQYGRKIFEVNTNAGWFDEEVPIGTQLALIHSEVSEMLEADRRKDGNGRCALSDEELSAMIVEYGDETFKDDFNYYVKDTMEDEAADVIIRILDTAQREGFLHRLDMHVKAKIRYNSLRPHRHGKKY